MKCILIVDDFKNTRYVTRMMLERNNYEVLEAEDGQHALNVLGGDKTVDLVVTDYNMPIMNGVELVEKMREMTAYKYIPVILLTTETDDKKKERANKAGITGWVVKPFDFKKFLTIIEKALK